MVTLGADAQKPDNDRSVPPKCCHLVTSLLKPAPADFVILELTCTASQSRQQGWELTE
jgi:hypothetical protein